MTWQKLLHHISIASGQVEWSQLRILQMLWRIFLSPPSPKAYVKETLYATVDFVWNGISNRSSVAVSYL